MSKKSWLKEFYPVEACKVSESEALKHSIRKWKGARKEALAKHNCFISEYRTISTKCGVVLRFDADSCALCSFYIDCGCIECPLYKVGCKYCDEDKGTYTHFIETGDPEPMIELLEKCERKTAK